MVGNKKEVQRIVAAFIILVMIFLIVGTPRYQSIRIKNEGFLSLENKIKEASNANSEIDINKLTNFLWDECYVFTPYYPSRSVYERVGTEWTTSQTYIGFLIFHGFENETVNDDRFLMVFKKANKIVLAQKYSLSELPVIFKLDNNKFTSNNAKFLVIEAKQYGEGRLKELVLKN